MKPKIAILTPSTSRGRDYGWDDGELEQIDLTSRLCRSLYPKIQDKYEYALYLGYDPGDAFYDREEPAQRLKEYLARRYPRLQLHYLKIPGAYDSLAKNCLLYTSPSPRDATLSRMPSSA